MTPKVRSALDGLNEQQRAAATALSHALVLACPGSGKTKMLSVKAALLLCSPDNRVGMVTFARDSAIELRDRTLATADEINNAKGRLTTGTFHSLCYKMLSRHRKIDLRAIIGDGEALSYAIRAMERYGVEGDVSAVVRQIELVRTGQGGPLVTDQHRLLAKEYTDLLRRNGKIDFTDLVVDTLQALENGTIAPMPLTHMLVDEYQDTDALQYKWVRAHSEAGTIVTVVGDDDQAIFSWRFAMGYSGMTRFADDHDAERIILATNYRCRAEILTAAGHLIAHNPERQPKMLQAARGSGGSVRVFSAHDVDSEADVVVDTFADFNSSSYTGAVLCRTKRALTAVAVALRSFGIPVDAPRSASVLDSEEGRVFLDLADCISNQSKRGMDHALSWAGVAYEDLRQIHALRQNDLRRIKPAEYREAGVSDEGGETWNHFVRTFAALRLANESGEARINLILEGIRAWMDSTGRYQLLSVQADNARFTQMMFTARQGALSERLNAIRNMIRADKGDKNSNTRKVVLTTMHAAKGLEWDKVHIIRAENGVCPSANALDVEEERRLFYVAMTRARDSLTITHTSINSMSIFVHQARLTPL